MHMALPMPTPSSTVARLRGVNSGVRQVLQIEIRHLDRVSGRRVSQRLLLLFPRTRHLASFLPLTAYGRREPDTQVANISATRSRGPRPALLRHALPVGLHETEVVRRRGMALLGSPPVPPHRFGIVFGHTPAVFVRAAQGCVVGRIHDSPLASMKLNAPYDV